MGAWLNLQLEIGWEMSDLAPTAWDLIERASEWYTGHKTLGRTVFRRCERKLTPQSYARVYVAPNTEQQCVVLMSNGKRCGQYRAHNSGLCVSHHKKVANARRNSAVCSMQR